MRRVGTTVGLVAAAWSCLAGAATVSPLALDGGPFVAMAASPNGQTVYAIDERHGHIVAFDPFRDAAARAVVADPSAAKRRPLSLAALPGDVLAVAARDGDAWSIVTYRLRPKTVVAESTQTLVLGVAPGAAACGAAVSRRRDWFAMSGLPAPLPPVVRALVAGGSVRRLTDDSVADAVGCPSAVAVSPGDELVLCDPGSGNAPADLVFLGMGGRERLRLPTGLREVRGMAFTRDDGDLYVLAAPAAARGAAGLWRLDAVMRHGEQAVRPTCVAELDAPWAVVAVSARSLVVVHGADASLVSRVDLPAWPTDGVPRDHEETDR